MTFKINWEKTQTTHNLSHATIKKMVKAAFPAPKVESIRIISGGCSNINVKVDLAVEQCSMLLRIYLNHPSVAHIEQKIAQKLQKKVPVAQISRIFSFEGYTLSICEFAPGKPLRDYLLQDKLKDNSSIMFEVGKVLGEIASNKFSDSGFFNERLDVFKPQSPEDLFAFINNTLHQQGIKETLGAQLYSKVGNIIESSQHLLLELNTANLVHGDFDPANILIVEENSQLNISAVLDWEYCFAGSPLWDVANMLRYAHQMPCWYERAFIDGLQSTGYSLPKNWRKSIYILNFISLLDLLNRTNLLKEPNRTSDILNLIHHFTTQ